MEENIEITLVPKEQIGKDKDMIRITLNTNNKLTIAWGFTLLEAINNFDKLLIG
jgi:hypothetical protein